MNKSILSAQSERFPDYVNFPQMIETLENVQKVKQNYGTFTELF
jgi:hypothetical protein